MTELRQHPVRLVVLDIGLPGIDGFEVCRRIRAGSNVPIIMLTARDEEPDRVAGLEIGADDYVAKPFSPRELSARIKAILRRSEQRNEDEVLSARDDRPAARLARGDRRRRSGRAHGQGVRPPRVLPRASRHRPLARAVARSRLGDDVPRRHAHGRHARRAAAPQARRRGRDPHRARRRLQAHRQRTDARRESPLAALPGDRSRRHHLRRADDRARPRPHAARGGEGDAAGRRAPGGHRREAVQGSPSADRAVDVQRSCSQQHESSSNPDRPASFPDRAAAPSHAHATGAGDADAGTASTYYYAARYGEPARTSSSSARQSTATSLWSSYVWGLLIAAGAGGLLAARRRVPRRAPDLASGRPDRDGRAHARGRHASRAGAGRGRYRDRDARRLVQRARRAAPASAGSGAELPPLGQPRAQDAAHRDPRLRRGGRGRRDRAARGGRDRDARRRDGSSGSSRTSSTSRA